MPLALGKRAGNTAGLPVRLAGTALYGGLDVVNTVATLPKQSYEIVSDTTQKIKDVLNNSRNEGKWYRKIWRAPLGTIVAAGTAIEGTGRAILNPSWNAILHSRDVLGNFLVNPGNAIKSVLSDKPVSDFKYEHLKTRDISKKNWMANLITGGKKSEKKDDKPADKKEEKPVEKKDDKPADKKDDKPAENKDDEKKILDMEAILKEMKKQNEETNKKLAEILDWKKSMEEGEKGIRNNPKNKGNPKNNTAKINTDNETPAMAA